MVRADLHVASGAFEIGHVAAQQKQLIAALGEPAGKRASDAS
jgi:hypothetical protein